MRWYRYVCARAPQERQQLEEQAARIRDRDAFKRARRRARLAKSEAKQAGQLKAISREVQRVEQRAADLRQSEEEAMQRARQEEQRSAASGAVAVSLAAQRQRLEASERRAAERHARLEAVAMDRQKLIDKCAKLRERAKYKKEKARYKDQKLSAKTHRRLSAVERAQHRLEERCAAAREWQEEVAQRRQSEAEQLAAQARQQEQDEEERQLLASAERLDRLRRREDEKERKRQEADEKAAARQRKRAELEQQRRELAEAARAEKRRRREEADVQKLELARQTRAEEEREQQAAADDGRETSTAALLGAAGAAGWASLLTLALVRRRRCSRRPGDALGDAAGAHRRVRALAQRAGSTQRCGRPAGGPPPGRAHGGEPLASGLGAALQARGSSGVPPLAVPRPQPLASSPEGPPGDGCPGSALPRLGGPPCGPLDTVAPAEVVSQTPPRGSPRWHSRLSRLSRPPRGFTIDGWDAFFDKAGSGLEPLVTGEQTSSRALPSEGSYFIGDDDSAGLADRSSSMAESPGLSGCSAMGAPETLHDSSSEDCPSGQPLDSPPPATQLGPATSSLCELSQGVSDTAAAPDGAPTPTSATTAHARRRWSNRPGAAAGPEPNALPRSGLEAVIVGGSVPMSSAVAPARRRRQRAPETLTSPPAPPPGSGAQPAPPEARARATAQLAPLVLPAKAGPGRSSTPEPLGSGLRASASPRLLAAEASPKPAGPGAPAPREQAGVLPEPGPEPCPGHVAFFIGDASSDEESPPAEAQGPAPSLGAPAGEGAAAAAGRTERAGLPPSMEGEVQLARAALRTVRLACVELRASTRFQAAVAMLQGAARAALGSPAAPGFELEGLLQLADTRGASGLSVVHYVCLECHLADPGFLSGLQAELRHVPLAARAAGALAGIPEQLAGMDGVARAALRELGAGRGGHEASRTRAAVAACEHFLGRGGSEAAGGGGLGVGAIVLAEALLERFGQAWHEVSQGLCDAPLHEA
ncbi:unnamed protein product [Prorocentrum cordatum]|uniref:Uncharacterized protein n=1 Tax=Prorocentrum cordatum TaxID=2364126 RepID=A0ABN9UEU7_9DINO|nr:unnamed protein product [Polarella glacialis]